MSQVTTVLLIKEDSLGAQAINDNYLDPLASEGIPIDSILILPLMYNPSGKVLAKTGKAYLDKLINRIPGSVTKLIVVGSSYFKIITKLQRVSDHYGATVKGAYAGYDKFDCVYVPNHKSLFKQPENAPLITQGLKAIAGTSNTVIINSAEYGLQYGTDKEILDSLYKYPVLVADIETTGLGIDSSIVSIAFAWTKHDGVAIDISISGQYYLRKFLETYSGKLVFHNGLFDAKLLISNLWMDHNTDYVGMMKGLNYFRTFDDTMILTYLAKNATTHVPLNLKEAALEYVGNYAIDIKDITKYSKKKILQYNLIDALGTFHLYEKYKEELTSEPYLKIFQPSLYTLLKIMLVGLPMDSDRVDEVTKVLTAKEHVLRRQIQTNPHIISFNAALRADALTQSNEAREARILSGVKVRALPKVIEDFADLQFNPASHPQIGKLLFEILGLPILETTKTKAPSTGGDVLEDLKNHTTDIDILDLLKHIQNLAEVEKINGTFIKAFLQEKDFLHGNLKLGGTQSGRLSSNSPNLTNLPAHGTMGKLVKSCVVAPDGWLFAAADFSALEERIGAILSQDPNRIKVYTDGYDGHSMRAYKYFSDQMPDITAALAKAETATKYWIDDKGEYCCG